MLKQVLNLLKNTVWIHVQFNAIAAHHDDVEATTPEAIIVKITDAMSASRPGVRNAAAENFYGAYA